MRDIFFTSDTHFSHSKILKHHPRRGSSAEEMNENLIERWNNTVSGQDEVWVLGDFYLGPANGVLSIFHRLNGRKHLVAGNHDHRPTLRLPWTSVGDIWNWRQKPYKAVLCHFPMLTWAGAHIGVWMLHGHSHGLLEPSTTTRMDVGIDTHPEMRPYSLDEVIEYMSDKEYIVVDGHGLGRKKCRP